MINFDHDGSIKLLTLILPTYNRLPLLKIALSSILRDYLGDDIEIVVVDNGSTDGTSQYLSMNTDPRIVTKYFD